MNWAITACVLGALIPAGCSREGTRKAASESTPIGPPNRAALIREEHLPNLELITHEGRRVQFYDDLVKGKVVAINFMYTKCQGICQPATEHLVEVRKLLGERMGREVTFLSISLDPERDTPERLRDYMETHGVAPGWHFLTGKTEDIQLLRRKLGVYELDPVLDADRTQHGSLVILGNEPKGRWQAVSALVKPVRIRQAIERTMLPPSQWRTGPSAVAEAPYEMSAASLSRVEPADLSKFQYPPP